MHDVNGAIRLLCCSVAEEIIDWIGSIGLLPLVRVLGGVGVDAIAAHSVAYDGVEDSTLDRRPKQQKAQKSIEHQICCNWWLVVAVSSYFEFRSTIIAFIL